MEQDPIVIIAEQYQESQRKRERILKNIKRTERILGNQYAQLQQMDQQAIDILRESIKINLSK